MPRNSRITIGRTIREWSGGELTFRKPNIRTRKLIEERVNGGMITSIDASDIPPSALQLAKNAKVVFDKTSRRDGSVLFGPTPPDFNAVLKMSFMKHPSGSGHTYRFTPVSIHDLQSGAWVPITQVVPLVGTASDRLNVTTNFDVFAFTNNGANNVQWIDSTTDQSDDLIENLSADLSSSRFRFCTGFYNRIVLAALRGENEIMLAWTGEYGSKNTSKHGLEDLDPLVNETSGFGPLVNSPSDVGDFITGVFGLTSVMVILREQSIWLSTKQASFTNPFNSNAAVPGIGCDTPYSAKVTEFGLSWLDRRTRTVYAYSPGGLPEPIGQPVEKSIINNISDPQLVFGSYDPIEKAYSVNIPSVASNFTQTWTYYFRDNAWTYNEYPVLTSMDVVELLTGFLAIDDLVGTMDELVGSFDDLSPIVTAKQERVFGYGNGLLANPDPTVDYDLVEGNLYTTDLISKSFELPGVDVAVAEIVVEYQASIEGVLELWYATDGGVNPPNNVILDPTVPSNSFYFADSYAVDPLNKPQIITFKRVIHCRRFAFLVRAKGGQFDILKYQVHVTAGGDIDMTRQVI